MYDSGSAGLINVEEKTSKNRGPVGIIACSGKLGLPEDSEVGGGKWFRKGN